jgi:dTDP-4-amino-4,6-dideoxygalactose transaminase
MRHRIWLVYTGTEVSRFEAEYAFHCGAPHCIGVANGLDTLTLALKAMCIGHGDEVIVPSNTYIATLLAVSETSAKLIPLEPDITTYNIDLQLIESAISERIRAIVPVHLYGQPAAKSAIVDLANRDRLQILEDGAQSHGARYRGKPIGNHGDAVAWSFYPGKNRGALGDGIVVTHVGW